MHLAAAEGHEKIVEWLLHTCQSTADRAAVSKLVNAVDAFDGTPIEGAMENGHSSIVALLRSHGGALNDAGKLAQLRSLVEGHNVSVNLADYDQRSSLHVAAASGQAEAVAFLLKNKADCQVKDRWGQTPMEGATR